MIAKDEFQLVLAKVKDGLTIREACDFCGVNSRKLYRDATEDQKTELKASKMARSKHGKSSQYNLTKYSRLGFDPDYLTDEEE